MKLDAKFYMFMAMVVTYVSNQNLQCLICNAYIIYIDVDMDDLLTHCIRFDDLHNNLDMTHSNRSILSNRTVIDILDNLLA